MKWKRDTNLHLPSTSLTVTLFLAFPTQHFPSFNTLYLPLTFTWLSALALYFVLLFTFCPPSFAFFLFYLTREAIEVIFLSEMGEGHWTHGNYGFSVSTVSLVNGNSAKTRRHAQLCTHGCGQECVSSWRHLGNGRLTGLPGLPGLATFFFPQITRISWPYVAAQGCIPVSLIKMQSWHTYIKKHTHVWTHKYIHTRTHPGGL